MNIPQYIFQRRFELPSLLKMSQLRKHSTFVYLLGETTSAAQKRALLKTITPGQFQALTLVLYNIIHLKVPSDSCYRKKLKRYKTALTLITNRKVGKATRLSTLKGNPTAVSLLIKSALPGLKNHFINMKLSRKMILVPEEEYLQLTQTNSVGENLQKSVQRLMSPQKI